MYVSGKCLWAWLRQGHGSLSRCVMASIKKQRTVGRNTNGCFYRRIGDLFTPVPIVSVPVDRKVNWTAIWDRRGIAKRASESVREEK